MKKLIFMMCVFYLIICSSVVYANEHEEYCRFVSKTFVLATKQRLEGFDVDSAKKNVIDWYVYHLVSLREKDRKIFIEEVKKIVDSVYYTNGFNDVVVAAKEHGMTPVLYNLRQIYYNECMKSK